MVCGPDRDPRGEQRIVAPQGDIYEPRRGTIKEISVGGFRHKCRKWRSPCTTFSAISLAAISRACFKSLWTKHRGTSRPAAIPRVRAFSDLCGFDKHERAAS